MDIRVPELAENIEKATVVSVLVAEGQAIQQGNNLIELETQKAVAPLPSPVSGKVTKIYVKVGQEVAVGQAVAAVSEETVAESPSTSPAPSSTKPAQMAPAAAATGAAPQTTPPAAEEEFRYVSKSGLPPPASPEIRRMARELGIDLTLVRGTASGGRITHDDLKRYIAGLRQKAAVSAPAAGVKRPAAAPIDFSKWGPIQKEKISPLRKTVGQRMSESWTTIPHVTQLDEADVTTTMTLVEKHAAAYQKQGASLTLTAVILKIAAEVLKKHPRLNSSLNLETEEIIFKQYVHLGVAVDTPAGLIVPVIRDVDKKTVLEICKALTGAASRARDRKLSLEELQGASFTVSNLGGIGGGHFSPIVNPPEVAILGLARAVEKPVIREGKVVARWMMPISVSYDHRAVDGADGARFIKDLVARMNAIQASDIQL